MPSASLGLLRQLAQNQGFSIVAVASVNPLGEDRDRLLHWQNQGYAAEMEFMKRDAEILASPLHFLPTARSGLVLTATYDQTPVDPPPPGFGRVARYAWGKDYHRVLRKRLDGLVDGVEKAIGESVTARVFSDSVPLLERALARSAGTGFVGKNTMVISPGIGSFFFLAEILWDVVVTDVPAENGVSGKGCGSCSRCINSCPTNAFNGPYSLNAGKCIAYLTIEKRSALTLQERKLLGNWMFGCDVCQEVCPFNYTPIKKKRRATIQDLSSSSGIGPYLNLNEVLRIRTHAEYVSKFSGTAIMRAKREGLVRNAAIVAANTCAEESVHDLITAVNADSSALVRRHAAWASVEIAVQLGTVVTAQVKQALEPLLQDPDSGVKSEVEELMGRL